MTATKRTRRPMIEMTGTVADLRPQDYVDTLGGGVYRRSRVGALVHRVEHKPGSFDEDRMWRLLALPGFTARKAERSATTPQHATVEFLTVGTLHLLSDVPVQFRRFAD